MNRVTLITSAFLLLFVCDNVWSQNTFHSLNYPLNIGDYWEYIYSPAFLETREVIGDTLMPNGKLYRIVRQEVFGFTTFSFQRVSEENELFQIDQFETEEYLRFKLDTGIEDSWKIPVGGGDSLTFTVTEMGDTTLWAHEFKYTKIVAPEAFALEFIIVDSIGIFYEGFEGGNLELQGALINNEQFGVITSVHSVETNLSETLVSFFHNYPNPFNASTTFEYQLSMSSHVQISIFNVLGEKVKILSDGFQVPGHYKINWNGNNQLGISVSSGSYFYLFEVNDSIKRCGKLSFLK